MTLLQLATWFSVPLVRIIRGAATGRGLTSMADPAEPEATSTAVGSAIPLRAIDVEEIIKAISYHNDTAPGGAEAPEAQLLADFEPCTCELVRCASCDRLPWVIQQRLAVSDLQGQTSQTVETVNSSPTSWGSLSRQWQ